jgi:tRNA(fMet)-specific endonuclease VapC
MMSCRYLLDTNTASYIIKGNVPRVRERLLRVSAADALISVITEAELRFGVLRRPDAKRLNIVIEEFLRFIEIRPWDSAAARYYAELRAALETGGQPMGGLDMMIAAHALALGAVLVSSDRVFRRVKGLKLENWDVPV